MEDVCVAGLTETGRGGRGMFGLEHEEEAESESFSITLL